ncbi:MAG: RnfABCDGE type electron transport complex subunit B [Betaproteobacteria bacterium]|nr:RnfABCDGE type electron transport complex subunit B [Betaproteobacteria bacterium]
MSRLPPRSRTSSEAIDAVLPQTQCTRCGYPCCRDYADAIATGDANINQCPPGGLAGIQKLSALTGLPVLPLNPANGEEGPRQLAWIDEARCIGCTLCIKACPVDAIVGGFKFMHTVLADQCTGCELCVAPCPVNCIDMITPIAPLAWTLEDAATAKARFIARQHRQQGLEQAQQTATDKSDQLKKVLERARQRARSRLSDRDSESVE